MSDSARWSASETATVVVCGVAAAIGLAWGIINGVTQGGSVMSKVFISLVQGAGAALIFGIVALIVVAVVSLLWAIASEASGRSR